MSLHITKKCKHCGYNFSSDIKECPNCHEQYWWTAIARVTPDGTTKSLPVSVFVCIGIIIITISFLIFLGIDMMRYKPNNNSIFYNIGPVPVNASVTEQDDEKISANSPSVVTASDSEPTTNLASDSNSVSVDNANSDIKVEVASFEKDLEGRRDGYPLTQVILIYTNRGTGAGQINETLWHGINAQGERIEPFAYNGTLTSYIESYSVPTLRIVGSEGTYAQALYFKDNCVKIVYDGSEAIPACELNVGSQNANNNVKMELTWHVKDLEGKSDGEPLTAVRVKYTNTGTEIEEIDETKLHGINADGEQIEPYLYEMGETTNRPFVSSDLFYDDYPYSDPIIRSLWPDGTMDQFLEFRGNCVKIIYDGSATIPPCEFDVE